MRYRGSEDVYTAGPLLILTTGEAFEEESAPSEKSVLVLGPPPECQKLSSRTGSSIEKARPYDNLLAYR